ncbi:MAG: hypothetical protein LCH95_06485 [Proteobacteria bacterium]|nr:hypothetical protein [Pseudomonadota bacterium]
MNASTDRLLRRTLWANAGLSIASGAVLAIFAGPLARLAAPAPVAVAGLDLSALLALLGIGFVAFGGLCAWVASRAVLPLAWGRAIFLLDASWVAISAVLLALPGVWSTAGIVGIAGMALVVADLAILEYLGLRRIAGADLRPAH